MSDKCWWIYQRNKSNCTTQQLENMVRLIRLTMKKTITLICFCLSLQSAFAQKVNIDSVYQTFATEKNESQRLNLLNLFFSGPDTKDLIFTEIPTQDDEPSNYYLGLSSYDYQGLKAFGHAGFWATKVIYQN